MMGSRKTLLVCGVIGLIALGGVTLSASPAPAQDGATLPDAPELFSVEAQCGYCHDAAPLINRSMGYTREGWEEFVSHMAPSGPETQNQILDYLAQHFGPSHNQRPATLVTGPLQVSFQSWIAPTPGQGLRGPAQAPDGSIWFVGTRNNNIGTVNPTTGQVREWALPADTMPDSVAIDAQGGVWFTGNGNGTIGRFDAATGQATVHQMSDAAARDPHSAAFDRNGIMWFTVERANMIGRFDPQSGQTRFARVATADARPFGIAIAPDGTPWVSCSGSNCLIRVNPQTLALTEVRLPAGATARRLDVAADGAVWYTNFSQGKIGRVDVSGEVREWNSPSGANAQPYAIAIVNGVVWYNESGVRPDPLVRFDPRTESFQSWAIQSGGIQAGMVRQMRPSHDGANLVLHQDATNRVILATLPPAG